MEIETEVTCPHCGRIFDATVEVEPSDWRDDRD